MSRTIRITRTIAVEVDLDVWQQTYGNADAQAAARDARRHVPATIANAVHAAFQQQANGAELIGSLYELVEQ